MRKGRSIARSMAALLALAVTLGFAASATAQQAVLETDIKATFLHRFGSFADWPPTAFTSSTDPLVICVAGAPTFASAVQRAAGADLIGGRQVSVRTLGAVTRNSGCHVLFAGGGSGQSVSDALSTVRGEPVLTVTDAANGGTRGAIHFVLASERVRFHIDRGAAEENHITLSSRLLDIALSVRRRGGTVSR